MKRILGNFTATVLILSFVLSIESLYGQTIESDVTVCNGAYVTFRIQGGSCAPGSSFLWKKDGITQGGGGATFSTTVSGSSIEITAIAGCIGTIVKTFPIISRTNATVVLSEPNSICN